MDENNNVSKEVVKRKTNWGFTLFACIATGVIVFLAMNLGEKAGKIVDPDTKSPTSNVTSNQDSNSNSNEVSNSNDNVDSNVESNVNSNQPTSNVTSNTGKNIHVELKEVSDKGTVTGTIIATENGKQIWEYKTPKYSETELKAFTMYQGKDYIYLSEAGKMKALNKETGKEVWKSNYDIGYSAVITELNGKLYATGYYKNNVNIIEAGTGKLIKTVPMNGYIWPTKIEVKDNNTLVIDCTESSTSVKVEFNINNYTIKKVK